VTVCCSTAYGRVSALFEAHGGETYGESVSQLDHALQCAALAEAEGARPALLVAALLHDIGHLLEVADDAYGLHRHDKVGAAFLAQLFGPEVCEPVRLHVAAKRYLCATEPGYLDRLSEASTYSLGKQGGPMGQGELFRFEAHAHAAEALSVRLWDDNGKFQGLTIPPLEYYRDAIEALARPA